MKRKKLTVGEFCDYVSYGVPITIELDREYYVEDLHHGSKIVLQPLHLCTYKDFSKVPECFEDLYVTLFGIDKAKCGYYICIRINDQDLSIYDILSAMKQAHIVINTDSRDIH